VTKEFLVRVEPRNGVSNHVKESWGAGSWGRTFTNPLLVPFSLVLSSSPALWFFDESNQLAAICKSEQQRAWAY